MPQQDNDLPALNAGRMWSILFAVTAALGGWWMQNQWNSITKLEQTMADNERQFEQRYVSRDYFTVVIDRLDRIERTLDKMENRLDRDQMKVDKFSGSTQGKSP